MLIFEKKDKIAYITLNRPEKYNSINKELAYEFQNALDVKLKHWTQRTPKSPSASSRTETETATFCTMLEPNGEVFLVHVSYVNRIV